MIRIFCDFCQFSAIFANFRRFLPIFGDLGNFWRKIGIVLKNQCYDPNFAKTSSIYIEQQTPIFASFGAKKLKIITSVLETILFRLPISDPIIKGQIIQLPNLT
jgi:hypothetical protein